MPPPVRLSAHMDHLRHRDHPMIQRDPARRRRRRVHADTVGAVQAVERGLRLLQEPRVWAPYRARRQDEKERARQRRGFAVWQDASARVGAGDENDDDDEDDDGEPDDGDDGGDDPDNADDDNDNNDDGDNPGPGHEPTTDSANGPNNSPSNGDGSFPPPNMLAPWYAARPAASPPADTGFADPAGGDSWQRLGRNATYGRNDADVRLFHQTLRRLRRRYRLHKEDESLQPRRHAGDGADTVAVQLHRSDAHRVCRALEHGAQHPRDLFANDPVWAAWREAPNDGFDPDPEMPRVLAALAVQRRRFKQLHACLCGYARAMEQQMAKEAYSASSHRPHQSGDTYSRQLDQLTQTHRRLLRLRKVWRKPLGVAISKENTQW